MAIALLPSEIARLILNYLEGEGLKKTHGLFLNECKYLEECKYYVARGISIPKTIHGKKLEDFLRFDEKKVVETTSSEAQTEPVNVKINLSGDKSTSVKLFTNSTTTKNTVNNNNNNSKKGIDVNKQKESKNNEPEINSINNESTISSDNNDDVIFISNNKIKPIDQDQANKPRLLIGKNTEKIPELSISTLGRQLDSIVSDASNLIKQQEEQEEHLKQQEQQQQQQQATLNYSLEPQDTLNCDLESSQIIKPINSNNLPILLPSAQLGTNNFLNALAQVNLNMNTATFNGVAGTIVPLVLNDNNISNFSNQVGTGSFGDGSMSIRSSAVPVEKNIVKPKPNNVKPAIVEIKPRLANTPRVETNPKENLCLDKLSQLKRKRGPIKREGPKKKPVFNRVTPTIKQMIQKESEHLETDQASTFMESSNCGMTDCADYLKSGQIDVVQSESLLKPSQSSEELYELLGLKNELAVPKKPDTATK